MLTVLSVLGTRPEAIKMAPIIRESEKYPDKIRSLVCATGQHREMLDQVLTLFDIRPDFDLDVMQPDQSLSGLTARILTKLEPIAEQVKPDWILAQGDTTSVMVASLVAYYHRIPFGHVEAGLRTDDRYSPFPEEMNRRVSDTLATLHFAPTQAAAQALLREGFPAERIHVTGNTVVDALRLIDEYPYDWSTGPLFDLATSRPLVLVTAHRRESFGDRFQEICLAIRDLATLFDEIDFVYPVHLNPNVRHPANEILSGLSNVVLLEPLDYLSLVQLMKRAKLILTDSGGIQEEAPSFGVPVLVMREKTERPEGVNAGVARLVGTQRERIVAEARRLLEQPDAADTMRTDQNPYGDGYASRRIVHAILRQGM